MSSIPPFHAVYDVAVERETLQAGRLGPEGIRYTVGLSGGIDARWSRAFRVLRIEDPDPWLFAFDCATGTVAFDCSNGRAATVLAALDALDSFVSMINENAGHLTGEVKPPVILSLSPCHSERSEGSARVGESASLPAQGRR